MTARIARGTPTRRRARKAAPRRSVDTRRRRSASALDSFGFSPGARRLGGWAFAGLLSLSLVALLFAFRLPQIAGVAVGEAIGAAGFAMRRVEIRGAHRVPRLDVYNIAFDQESTAMPLIDLEATRSRLLEFGWIKEARVLRRLPDTLVVDLVERRPAAIWEHDGTLSLIDAEGVVLEPVRIERMPDLPLVTGRGANGHLPGLNALLTAAPHLRPQVTGATWIGGRRWDVRFQTGELLSLPEGPEAARRAIARFALMDQQSQMLGRGFARFDMRDPRRMIVRISRDPGSTVPEPPPSSDQTPVVSRTI